MPWFVDHPVGLFISKVVIGFSAPCQTTFFTSVLLYGLSRPNAPPTYGHAANLVFDQRDQLVIGERTEVSNLLFQGLVDYIRILLA
jgi:hypothetical protein